MYFRYLKRQFRDQMRAHALNDDDIRQASCQMKAKSKKNFIIGMVCYAGFIVLMLAAGIFEYMTKTDFTLSRLIEGMVLLIITGFVAAYILPVGLLKFQFNKELKSTYSHLYHECKL